MSALQSRNSVHPARCPSTGHGTVRLDRLLPSRIVRQLSRCDAMYHSFRSRFDFARLAGASQSQAHALPVALKLP
jgi:hypothetical protein